MFLCYNKTMFVEPASMSDHWFMSRGSALKLIFSTDKSCYGINPHTRGVSQMEHIF